MTNYREKENFVPIFNNKLAGLLLMNGFKLHHKDKHYKNNCDVFYFSKDSKIFKIIDNFKSYKIDSLCNIA